MKNKITSKPAKPWRPKGPPRRVTHATTKAAVEAILGRDRNQPLYMAKSSSSGQRELNQAMTIGLPAIVCKVGLWRC
jgi:hypothetical protein